MTPCAAGLSAPTTMRSGYSVSSTAVPSLRNSGLETTSWASASPRLWACSVSAWRMRSPVWTGTVDFSTTTVGRVAWVDTIAAAAWT